jgi:hypothetical protein
MGLFGNTPADKTAKYNALTALYRQVTDAKFAATQDYTKLVGTNLATLNSPTFETDLGTVALNSTNSDELQRSVARQIRNQQKRLSILQSDFARLEVNKIPDFTAPLVSDEFQQNLNETKNTIRQPFVKTYNDALSKLGWTDVNAELRFNEPGRFSRSGYTSTLMAIHGPIKATTTQGSMVTLKSYEANDSIRAALQAKSALGVIDSELDARAIHSMMYGSESSKYPFKFWGPSTDEVVGLKQAWSRADSDVVSSLKDIKQQAIDMQTKAIDKFTPLLFEAEQRRQKSIASILADINNKRRLLTPSGRGRAPLTGFGD